MRRSFRALTLPLDPVSQFYSSVERRKAKRLLSFCYRRGVIGKYRRRLSIWVIDMEECEIALDDYEVVDLLKRIISSDESLSQAWSRMHATASIDNGLQKGEEAMAA